MREIVGALLGIPATMAIAGGLGLMAVTLWLRVRPLPGRAPVGWAQLVFGLGLCGVGAALLGIDVTIIGMG